MVLRSYTGRLCECHGGPAKRVYRYHAFVYCLTCLHSIGRNAHGNPCTAKQYREAWRKLAHEGA